MVGHIADPKEGDYYSTKDMKFACVCALLHQKSTIRLFGRDNCCIRVNLSSIHKGMFKSAKMLQINKGWCIATLHSTMDRDWMITIVLKR